MYQNQKIDNQKNWINYEKWNKQQLDRRWKEEFWFPEKASQENPPSLIVKNIKEYASWRKINSENNEKIKEAYVKNEDETLKTKVIKAYEELYQLVLNKKSKKLIKADLEFLLYNSPKALKDNYSDQYAFDSLSTLMLIVKNR